MITMRQTDFDTYNAIEIYIEEMLMDEALDRTADDCIAYAASLGVILTDDDIQSISWELDER